MPYSESGPHGRPVRLPDLEPNLILIPGDPAPGHDDGVIWLAVRVEAGLMERPECFGLQVEGVLDDDRSWAAAMGHISFRRSAGPGADLTVVLASPGTTDRLCRPLRTGGVLSCRREDRVIINAWRWQNGAGSFGDDLAAYRAYLVNHEVGHFLGRAHRSCPSPGALAPVMMQQTKGVDECRANPWPLPSESGR
jgi:hypothetical protein